ncbi:hypothetical protein [Sorangium sp. So ce1182]|uniref:hypothetical protein n=1 Tax=Sorangium sp. So ce1182 TaxID=3133334 RepID=UPI003F6162CD
MPTIGPSGVTASMASRTIGSTCPKGAKAHLEAPQRLGALDDGRRALVEQAAGVGPTSA